MVMNNPQGQLEAGRAGIDDQDVTESAPMVRALVVQRLEMIWRACEPHILPPPDEAGLVRRPDPRFVEAGIRVNDRLIQLYGLLRPQPSPEQGEDTAELEIQAATARIKALEARLRTP